MWVLYLILLWCAVTFITALIASKHLHDDEEE
jgi:hypothetical protein